jgi:hypothetical protein
MNLEGRVMVWSCPNCGRLMLAFAWKGWVTQRTLQNLLMCCRYLKPALRVLNLGYYDSNLTYYYSILNLAVSKKKEKPLTCLLIFRNVTCLVRKIALEKADGTKSYPDLFQKASKEKPCHQIKVGCYLILLGRGGIQQVCGVTVCGCLRFSSRPFRAQDEWKPRI